MQSDRLVLSGVAGDDKASCKSRLRWIQRPTCLPASPIYDRSKLKKTTASGLPLRTLPCINLDLSPISQSNRNLGEPEKELCCAGIIVLGHLSFSKGAVLAIRMGSLIKTEGESRLSQISWKASLISALSQLSVRKANSASYPWQRERLSSRIELRFVSVTISVPRTARFR